MPPPSGAAATRVNQRQCTEKVSLPPQIAKSIFFLLLLLPLVSGGIKYDYSIITASGKSSPDRDSCAQLLGSRSNRGPEGVEVDWKKRNCFCDDACARYSDCCIDAPAYNPEEQKEDNFACVNLKQYGDVYVRTRCDRAFAGAEETAKKCESPGDATADPFGNTPVTNTVTGVTYANYHCAVCNNAAATLEFWQPRLECPTLTGYMQRFNNLTKQYIEEKLHFDKDRRQWGVEMDVGGVPVFHECYVDPALPETLVSSLRECKNSVRNCSNNHNSTVTDLCSAYTGLVFGPNVMYRNVYCAECNGANIEKLSFMDLGQFGRFNWQQNFNTFSFAVLFDIGGDLSENVGFSAAKVKCLAGQRFDPFFKKCRNVACPKEHDVLQEDGQCVDSRTTTTTTVTTTASTSTTTTTVSTTTTSAAPTTTTKIPVTTIVPIVDIITTTSSPTTTTSRTTTTTTTTITTTTSSTTTTSTTTASAKTNNVSEETIVELTTVHSDTVPSAEFLECPKFSLEPGEYEQLNNHTVLVRAYDNKIFDAANFEHGPNGTIIICALNSNDIKDVVKLGPELGYTTFVCLGISVICCLLHLSASLLAPELQNLSGKNLSSLTVALLGGYTCFICSMFMHSPGSIDCFVLAVAMYYFFLSSFTWMLVIAFDVCRTLKLATTQLRLTAGAQWSKFVVYSLFGWVAPGLLVSAAVVLDILGGVEKEFLPGFGLSDLCWFSRKKALLFFFAVPFAAIMCANLLLFFMSACMVYDATKNSAKITTCGPKVNFHLYLRLAIIMGVTWVTGLVAGFIDVEPVWFGFVGLNALQGLFIFVAFTCTKKVMGSVRDKVLGKRSSASFGSSLPHNNIDTKKVKLVMSSFSTTSNNSSSSSSRGKTMYPVSNYQANCALTQNSFDGRYY